jgi:hypothetical protein
MPRPKGLLVTTLLFGIGVLLSNYSCVDSSKGDLIIQIEWRVLFVAIWYILLWYYWQGRNWTRSLLLIFSFLSILLLVVYGWDKSLVSSINLFLALLGAFLLVWLNLKPVKIFLSMVENARLIGRRLGEKGSASAWPFGSEANS